MTDITKLRRLHDRAFGVHPGRRSSADALSERSIALAGLTEYLREHGIALLDEIERLRADVARLEAENWTLAAGACPHDDGLIGDEHGNFYCAKHRLILETCHRLAGRLGGKFVPKDD